MASRSASTIIDSGPVYEVIESRETPVKEIAGKSWMGFKMGSSVSKEAALSEEGNKESVA
jgi:hypothetical protein